MNGLLSVQECELIARKYLKSEEVSNVDFTLKPLRGQNFALKINLIHQEEEKSLSFFAKSTSSVPKIYTIVDNFEQVLPNFDTSLIPKVYHANSNLVIFENLQNDGFRNCSTFSLDHVFAALKVLASFHAASLAFEETKSKSSKFRLDKEHALLHLNFSLKKPEVVKLISSVLETEEQVSKATEDVEERQFQSNYRKTLCHGSLISKNLLFKDENGSPKCKLINMKANFYAPPIYDVLQLIFFNTSADFRQHHWKTLLEHYHYCLKEETKRHDLDISIILAIDDLYLSAHHILPLIKLEAAILQQNDAALEELKEILTCSFLSKEDCYTIVKNKLATTNYKFLSFKVTPLSDVSGFLGEYSKVQIKVLQHSDETTINCFIKSTPKSGIPMEMAQDIGSFSREVFMYETLVPQMRKYGINTIIKCLPPSYFHRPKEFMVFEDMSLLNYQNLDAMKPLDFTTLTLLTQTLAKFHACSLILEEKVSEEEGKPYRLINAYGEYFIEHLFFEDEKHRGARSSITGTKSILTAVDLLTEIKTETNERNFRKFWPQLKELFFTVARPSDRFRNVLCHGDLWTSNLMVRFQNDKPTDCVLLDFQIVRYCPPAFDLVSMLYLTTHRSTRMEYEEKLLDVYYNELGRILDSYGYSVDSLFPYEDFKGSIEYIRPLMIVHAAIECVLTMCTPAEISSFLKDDETCRHVFFEDRTEFMTVMCEKSTLYRNRLKECILDVYDYCNSRCTES